MCKTRDDSHVKAVSDRNQSALSDLHAVDARYHDDCRKEFMGQQKTSNALRGKVLRAFPKMEHFFQ